MNRDVQKPSPEQGTTEGGNAIWNKCFWIFTEGSLLREYHDVSNYSPEIKVMATNTETAFFLLIFTHVFVFPLQSL